VIYLYTGHDVVALVQPGKNEGSITEGVKWIVAAQTENCAMLILPDKGEDHYMI
jgi:hypothetical protein